VKYEIAEEATFEEIARELGVSPNRARQLCVGALAKAKKACRRLGLSLADVIGKPVSMTARLQEWGSDE
jgi:DNA-directed RNA polymerase sigma subunit (sigma70/sigma32)